PRKVARRAPVVASPAGRRHHPVGQAAHRRARSGATKGDRFLKLLGMGLAALLVSLFGIPATSVVGATVEGTLYDGRESTVDRFRSLRPTGDEWHVPLANAEVTFHAYPTGKTYAVKTDEAGAFRIETFSGDPSSQMLVA